MSYAHEYDEGFYAYIDAGSSRSAAVVIDHLIEPLEVKSVLDVGCGHGAWCAARRRAGVSDVIGIDGDYVDSSVLAIPEESFIRHDLRKELNLCRRFDLVMSLEVAEHLSADYANLFVQNLVRHGESILFSAAVPGQGGEFHVNEQPPSYWRELFAAQGYRMIDFLRPLIHGNTDVEPWYRYNTFLYATQERLDRMPEAVRSCLVPPDQSAVEMASWTWRLRIGILRHFPQPVTHQLALAKHAISRRLARQ